MHTSSAPPRLLISINYWCYMTIGQWENELIEGVVCNLCTEQRESVSMALANENESVSFELFPFSASLTIIRRLHLCHHPSPTDVVVPLSSTTVVSISPPRETDQTDCCCCCSVVIVIHPKTLSLRLIVLFSSLSLTVCLAIRLSPSVRSSVCPIKLFVCLLVGLPASVLTSMCLLVFSVLVT